jgi:hypothetical protein
MRKGKIGLQKEISRIFNGIQIPKKEGSPAVGHPIVPPAHTAATNPNTAPPAPAKTPASSPVKQPAVHTNSVPAAPAQYVAPKTVQPTPHLFTIPEPPADSASKKLSHTESSVKSPVYETPAVSENVYEPPAINKSDNVYEPPRVPSHPAVENVKIELAPKKQWLDIIFKVINEIKSKLPAPKHGVSSTRQKIMMVLIPVLSVVFIVVLFKVLRAPAVKPPVASAGKTTGTGTVGDGKITWEIPAIYPDNLRDPMILGAVTTQSSDNTGKPSVKGIVYSEDHPIAVVGDRIVSVGEVVQGITVVKINPDSVEFSKGDQKWTQEVER